MYRPNFVGISHAIPDDDTTYLQPVEEHNLSTGSIRNHNPGFPPASSSYIVSDMTQYQGPFFHANQEYDSFPATVRNDSSGIQPPRAGYVVPNVTSYLRPLYQAGEASDQMPVSVSAAPFERLFPAYSIDLTGAITGDADNSSETVREEEEAANDTIASPGEEGTIGSQQKDDADKTEKNNVPGANKAAITIVTTFPMAGVTYSLDSTGTARDPDGEVVGLFAMGDCDLSRLGMNGEEQG